MRNKSVAAKSILRTPDSQLEVGDKTAEVRHERRVERQEALGDLKSRAERLAGSSYCIQNWKFKGAEEAFPNEPWMRAVDKYYPNAIGGPLLIDEPQHAHQLERCERKKKVLEERGYAYLVLKPHLDENEDRKELDQCRGRAAQRQ